MDYVQLLANITVKGDIFSLTPVASHVTKPTYDSALWKQGLSSLSHRFLGVLHSYRLSTLGERRVWPDSFAHATEERR